LLIVTCTVKSRDRGNPSLLPRRDCVEHALALTLRLPAPVFSHSLCYTHFFKYFLMPSLAQRAALIKTPPRQNRTFLNRVSHSPDADSDSPQVSSSGRSISPARPGQKRSLQELGQLALTEARRLKLPKTETSVLHGFSQVSTCPISYRIDKKLTCTVNFRGRAAGSTGRIVSRYHPEAR
jgi:hypothetical protein